ncbi:hypothetical protein GZL_02291 [Streptomyces sp. 769]|nr:hypothetical protein GZL_02291 [Streptomyces sp. 769]
MREKFSAAHGSRVPGEGRGRQGGDTGGRWPVAGGRWPVAVAGAAGAAGVAGGEA